MLMRNHAQTQIGQPSAHKNQRYQKQRLPVGERHAIQHAL